jgi:hypothetical protein
MIKISEVEQIFKDIFQEKEGLVQSIDTVWESSKNNDFEKLVISIHYLSYEETVIIHTKFIFKADKDKVGLIDNSFIYLWDLNCRYVKKEFRNVIDLKSQIEGILKSADFGDDIMILSDFIQAPAMFLNYYMKREKITDYSIFDVKYNPKFKTTSCDKMTFDFEVDINNNYKMDVSIKKIDKSSSESEDSSDINIYRIQFKLMDEITTIETDTLFNIHYIIGSNIAGILDKKTKGK